MTEEVFFGQTFLLCGGCGGVAHLYYISFFSNLVYLPLNIFQGATSFIILKYNVIKTENSKS
jgi:hypothetical protein